MILTKVDTQSTLTSIAPGRICLFGDHQDYLKLPVIACAIDRHIVLKALKNQKQDFVIQMPDIQTTRTIPIDQKPDSISKDDHLLTAIKVLKKYNCIPTHGYDVTISGNLPINAGISSSSAVLVAWVQFLLQAFGASHDITSELISKIAYEIEVLEYQNPGGKMDQYSIGLGNIIYLETDDNSFYQLFDHSLPGLIIGESGIPKETIGVLSELKINTWQAIHAVTQTTKDFDITKAKKEDLKTLLQHLPKHLQPLFYAAIVNHDITQNALSEFKKEHLDLQKIGTLMNEHHAVLRDFLNVSLPKIDTMIYGALKAGAYGAKIVGSGRGGSIAAIAPRGKEQQVIDAIMASGAKNAYLVKIDPGARIQ